MKVGMSQAEKEQSKYLGDGLYVYDDGYYIWLWTEREDGTHAVALDAPTLLEFERYIGRLKGAKS